MTTKSTILVVDDTPANLELRRLRVRLEHQAADLRRANEQLQTELAERQRSEAALLTLNQEMQASRSAALNLMDDAMEARDRLETANQGLRSEISERKRAEEALKLFRTLVDRSSDAIEVCDPETGRFLDVNERGCLDLGYSREEFLALRVFDIDPLVNPSAFTKIVEDLRKSGGLTWDGINRRKDGSTFPVEVNLKYVRFDHDYIVAVVRDITERKRTEAKMAEQLNELTRWHDVLLGREGRVFEVKKEVNELLARLGEPPRYPSALEGSGQ
jgi:PAS domain S-box-containing protein